LRGWDRFLIVVRLLVLFVVFALFGFVGVFVCLLGFCLFVCCLVVLFDCLLITR
jgi:hypothetical protein